MATWHQKQRPVKLYSETTYNVVTDSVLGMAVMCFATMREAVTYRDNVIVKHPGMSAYILPPTK